MTPPIIEMSIAPITNPHFTCQTSLLSFHHHMPGPVKAGLTIMALTLPSTHFFILNLKNYYAHWDLYYFCPPIRTYFISCAHHTRVIIINMTLIPIIMKFLRSKLIVKATAMFFLLSQILVMSLTFQDPSL